MTMITPSYLGETIEYSSLHACRSTLEDPTVPALVDIRNATMLDKRINCSSIVADGLGIKTASFAVGEVFFGCGGERDPA